VRTMSNPEAQRRRFERAQALAATAQNVLEDTVLAARLDAVCALRASVNEGPLSGCLQLASQREELSLRTSLLTRPGGGRAIVCVIVLSRVVRVRANFGACSPDDDVVRGLACTDAPSARQPSGAASHVFSTALFHHIIAHVPCFQVRDPSKVRAAGVGVAVRRGPLSPMGCCAGGEVLHDASDGSDRAAGSSRRCRRCCPCCTVVHARSLWRTVRGRCVLDEAWWLLLLLLVLYVLLLI
jgi:hypothetical protein